MAVQLRIPVERREAKGVVYTRRWVVDLTWMRSAYGVELRRQIVESASVDAVIEMHDAPAFEDEVSAYPAVVVLRKGKQGPALVGSANQHADTDAADGSLAEAVCALAAGDRESVVGFSATTLPEWYGGNQPWPWAEPEELRVLKWLEARFQPLEDPATGTRVGIGVATGADQVFVTTDRSVVEEERLLPLAMSADTTLTTRTSRAGSRGTAGPGASSLLRASAPPAK